MYHTMMLILNGECVRQYKVLLVLYNLALCKVCCQFTPISYNLSATTTYQELSSPGYPSSYPPDLDLIWYIETSNSSYVIRLEFLQFSTEDSGYCMEDRIQIYDGEPSYSNYLGTHCGRKLPDPVVSIGLLLTVKLQTDSSKYSTGFKARYIAGPESLLYYDEDGSSEDTTSTDNSVYIVLGVTTVTVLLIVTVVAVAVNIYKKVQAKKSLEQSQSRPNRRLSNARVYPLGFHGDQYNTNHNNFFNSECPPIHSDIPPRPVSPPPRYTMFDTNTFR